MKTQKIMGWHRYQVLADDNTPACIIEMIPTITDEEKEAILEVVRKLTMRALDECHVCGAILTPNNPWCPSCGTRQ